MSDKQKDKVECQWYQNPDRQWLEATWILLEQKAEANFFLSWLWMGTWLDSFVKQFHVIEAHIGRETVGLGIIVSEPCGFGLDRYRSKHYLHRTGVNCEDQIWIEYNDFLISSQRSKDIRAAMFSSVVDWMGKYDAFVVGASRSDLFAASEIHGLYERKIWQATGYSVELNIFLGQPKSLLKSLSRSSRYQISRSLRKYEEIGPVTVETMVAKEAALQLLSLAGPYHKSRWGEGESGSGFVNDKFVYFHTQLIDRAFFDGHIQLHHVKAGSETIGIIYNFKYKNSVYFYLCALNYAHTNISPHYKPGLVSHYLLLEKAISEGVERYDFLGGDARYKSTFANCIGSLAVYQYEHSHWLLFIENYARDLKHKLLTYHKS
ncbi:MAG: GNAT family N-acetyltransferase [Vibrio sp.]|uniref:GNAT family N-acetyltransferase n=1 Tax=Vibrio sp. TaxID=678 RepID=UPI003A89FA85